MNRFGVVSEAKPVMGLDNYIGLQRGGQSAAQVLEHSRENLICVPRGWEHVNGLELRSDCPI